MLFVSACNKPDIQEPPIIQTERIIPSVPEYVLSCPDIPIPPDPDTSTQRDVAVYLPDIIEVTEICKRNLDTVRNILNNAQ